MRTPSVRMFRVGRRLSLRLLPSALVLLVVSSVGLQSGAASQMRGGREARLSRPPTDAGRIDVAALRGRIAFSAGRSKASEEIYVVDANGSRLHRLTRNSVFDFDPSWSGDGKRIAFRSERDGNDEIYVMRADGSRARNLTRTGANEWGPAWSPDGRLIAFNSDRRAPGRRMELYATHPNGLGTRRLSRIYVEYPAWSPDGRRIAFMSQTPEGTED